MAKFRIHNGAGIDRTYEGDTALDALKKWAEEHPDEANQTVLSKKVED